MNFDLTKQDLENWAGFARIVRINERKIKELQENINFYGSIDYQKEISNKKPSDLVGNIVANYLAWQEALLREIAENLEKINNIEDKVDQIEDADIKNALRLRYGEGLSWGAVAKALRTKRTTVLMACKKIYST